MKLLSDTWLMFQRYLFVFLRNPAWVAIGVIQPVLYLVLFAPLLKSLTETPGFPSGGAYNVFVPGLLIQLGLFGASGVGVGCVCIIDRGARWLGLIRFFRRRFFVHLVPAAIDEDVLDFGFLSE